MILLISVCLTILLFDDYLRIITGFSYLGELSAGTLLLISITVIFKQLRINKTDLSNLLLLFFIQIALIGINLIANHNSYLFYSGSFIYECFKVIFPSLTLVVILFSNNHYQKLTTYLCNIFLIYVILNALALTCQWLFGASILQYVGLLDSEILRQYNSQRPTGFTSGANVIGEVSVLILIFTYLNVSGPHISIIRVLAVVCIILSTSKHALILLFIFLLFRSKVKPVYIISSVLAAFLIFFIVWHFDIYGLESKLTRYAEFISNFQNLDLNQYEQRAVRLFYGINFFTNDPIFGLGLGTWGDFSSSFNPYIPNKPEFNSMSDGYFIHILVEQGLIGILYFGLIAYILIQRKLGIYLLVFMFLSFAVTMGFSAATIPYIFYIALGKIMRNEKNTFDIKHVSVSST